MFVGTDTTDFTDPYGMVLAHEYAHAIQDYSHVILGNPTSAPCCPNVCTHWQCDPPCQAGPWVEGMAMGMSAYFQFKTTGNPGYDFNFFCGGDVNELRVAHFVFLMSKADARAFLATYQQTSGHHTDSNLALWPLPATMSDYWHAWIGEDDPAEYDIDSFHAGTFNAIAFYRIAIEHTLTGVEETGQEQGGVVVVMNAVGKGAFLVRVRAQQSGQANLSVFDVRGRLRTSSIIQLDKNTDRIHVVDLSSTPAGIYFLRAELPGTSTRVVGRIVNVK